MAFSSTSSRSRLTIIAHAWSQRCEPKDFLNGLDREIRPKGGGIAASVAAIYCVTCYRRHS
jgi:hypothetical protein